MRSIIGFVLGMLAPLTLLSQSFTIGGTDRDGVSAVAFDDAGNSYVAYAFTGSIDLDPGPDERMVISERDAADAPSIDVAIASYTSRGALRWGFSFGSPGHDNVMSMVVANGRVVITGMNSGPIYDMDPGEVLVSVDAPRDRYSALVASYDTSGAFQWVHSFCDPESSESTVASGLFMRADGSVVCTGHFDGTVDPDGPDAPVKQWVSKGPQTDVWVGCWAADGSMLWGETFGGVGSDEGRAIVGTADTFYVAGVFQQVIDLDPTDATLEQKSNGAFDTFLGCFTDSVRVQWGTRWGGRNMNYMSDQIIPKCLARQSDGSLVAAFVAWDTCTFGNDARPPFIATRGLQDVAVVCTDALGVHQWSFTVGGDKIGDAPYALSLTDDGSILVSGTFWGTADLDPSTAVATFRAASDSAGAAFIAQYSRDGAYQWARAYSAPNTSSRRYQSAWINAIAIDRAISDEIIAGGSFGGTITLGTAPGYSTVRVTSEGADDAMVLRFDQSGAIMFDALTSVEADDATTSACDIRVTTDAIEVAMRSGAALSATLYDLMGRRLASATSEHGAAVLPLERNEPCLVVVESDHQRYTARILCY
jgi:hypothetical protein